MNLEQLKALFELVAKTYDSPIESIRLVRQEHDDQVVTLNYLATNGNIHASIWHVDGNNFECWMD